jgi:hypothetical protein
VGAKHRTLIACAALLSALQLSACEPLVANGGATYFVFLTECQANGGCAVHPVERLDITVSTSAQKVAWKTTELDNSTAYTTATHCTVIAEDDFKCDELAMTQASLAYVDQLTDDHLISWILWKTSYAGNPNKMDRMAFKLLANGIVSYLAVFLAVIAGLAGLIGLGALSAHRAQADKKQADWDVSRKRREMGYDE